MTNPWCFKIERQDLGYSRQVRQARSRVELPTVGHPEAVMMAVVNLR
jgi:hypothetical protein